jgi:PAS domain S-box-containing protein
MSESTDRDRPPPGGLESSGIQRSLLDAAHDAVFLMDGNQFTDCNPRAEEMFGLPRSQIVGKAPWEISPPRQEGGAESKSAALEAIAKAYAGTPQRFEWLHSRPGGNPLYAEVSLNAVETAGKKLLLAIVRDINDRKRAEEALRLSEERFSKAFHNTPDAVTISSIEDGTVIEVNESFERTFGFTRDETIGNSFVRMDVWANPSDRDRAVAALGRGEPVRGWEVSFRRKSGEIGIAELNMSLLEIRGAPRILAAVRDITDRKRIEREKDEAFALVAKLKDELERERDYLREEVEVSRFGEIIAISPAMLQVLARIEAVAGTDASALIAGESGVGKELVARAIHARSARRSKPLVKVNCAAIPHDLFESEFFGHVKGSFTGAHQDRVGRFELANGGSLFLDEVSEIPIGLQGKLLRVLQEGEFERVGEAVTRKVDVRVISATNRNLKQAMEEGRFRGDLFYRLSVFPLEVPPLRERKHDIIPLAIHFLEKACRDLDRGPLTLTRAQGEALQHYSWPGNIRELQNVIEHAVILSHGRRLSLDLAPAQEGSGDEARESGASGAAFLTAAEFRRRERDNIVAALQHGGWKVSGEGGAAELLGVKPSTLTYRMKVLGIRRPARGEA